MSSIIECAAKSEGVKDLPAFATRKRCGRDLVQVCVGFTAKRLENLAQASLAGFSLGSLPNDGRPHKGEGFAMRD
jgi:hypothetical protein